jgi:uncharacterized protein
MRRHAARARTIAALLFGLLLGSTAAFAEPLADAKAAMNRGDYPAALKILRPAAERGDAEAQTNLGWMYEQGSGVTKDPNEAMKWYRLAAEHGSARAQYNLGVMYYEGRGAAASLPEALKWYRMAAANGDANAQYNLGFMYTNGVGVSRDLSRGHMWWDLASARGAAAAWANLDALSHVMSNEQLTRAHELEAKCVASHFKECE